MAISVAAMIVIAAFAIDRISKALFFLLSFIPQWNELLPDPRFESDPLRQAEMQRRTDLATALVTGALALILVVLFDIQILSTLNVEWASPTLDHLFGAAVLMGGSNQIGELLKSSKSPEVTARKPEPIQVTGSLILQEPARGGKT